MIKIIIVLCLMGCEISEVRNTPANKFSEVCLGGIRYYTNNEITYQRTLTPKIIKDGSGTSGFGYEECE